MAALGSRRGTWSEANRTFWIAGVLLAGLLVLGLTAPFLAPRDPFATDAMGRLAPPSADHLLGADRYGRDLLSRVLTALRIDVLGSLAAAVGAVALTQLVGLIRRGSRQPARGFWLTAALGLGVTLTVGTPLAMMASALVGSGVGSVIVSTTAGLLPWVILSGLRGGAGLRSQLAMWPLTWALGLLLMAELGYLGLGVLEPHPELGLMLSLNAGATPGGGLWLIWAPAAALGGLVVVLLGSAYLVHRAIRSP